MRASNSIRLATLAAAMSTVLAGRAPAASFTYTGPGGALADATGPNEDDVGVSEFEVTIAGTNATVGSITSLTLTNLHHTAIGDLSVFLVGPDGEAFSTITSPPGDALSNFNGTYTFIVDASKRTVDEAVVGKDSDYNLPGGTYALSYFDDGDTAPAALRSNFADLSGQPLDGVWTLQIQDYAAGEFGTIGSFSFSGQTAVAPEPASMAMLGLVRTLMRRRRA